MSTTFTRAAGGCRPGRQVVLSDFQDVGGVAFPRQVVARDFEYLSRWDARTKEWVPVGGETVIRTVVVEDVAINVPVDDSAFVIKFPEGAWIYEDGKSHRVNADGSLMNLSDR